MSQSSPLIVVWWPTTHEQAVCEQEGRLPVVRFVVLGDSGQIINKGQESIGKLPKDMPCLVLVHPSETSMIGVKPPPVSGKKLRDSLGFLVEPHLLNDPEENFLGYWPELLSESDKSLVSVIAKSRIREIASACKQHDLQLTAISSELLLNPARPTAKVSGETLILMDRISQPVAINLSQIEMTRAVMHRRSKGLGEAGAKDQKFEISTHDIQLLSGWDHQDFFNVSDHESTEYLTLLKRPLCSKDDLKKMGLRVGQSDLGSIQGLIRPFILLAVVAVVGLNSLAFKAHKEQENLREEIRASYQKALPDTPMVADPLLLIERAKRQLNQGSQTTNTEGLAYLFHELALSLDGAPFNSLTSIDWQNQQLKLTFNPNVTQAIQEEVLNKLKGKPIQANWIVGAGDAQPILQARWSRR